MKFLRSKAWWLKRIDNEPDVPIGAGSIPPVQPPELTLLLTVARILRSRIHEMGIAYQRDDEEALTEALRPWSADPAITPLHPNTDAKS